MGQNLGVLNHPQTPNNPQKGGEGGLQTVEELRSVLEPFSLM